MNNFVSVFEELSKLYEEDETKVVAQEAEVDDAAEAKEALNEGAEEDEAVDVEEAPADDAAEDADAEAEEEEPKKLVLECSKCGAIVCKDEAEVTVDEETDLANVEEACGACEEAAGYKILGELHPYEAAESVEEALETEDELSDPAFHGALAEATLTEGKILDNIKKVASRVGADAATIVRCFAELGDIITKKDTKFYEFAEYIENKAALNALMNGNEKVMNSLTKDDIEDLKADIAEYEKAKADGKATDDEDLEEGLFDGVFGKKTKPDNSLPMKGYDDVVLNKSDEGTPDLDRTVDDAPDFKPTPGNLPMKGYFEEELEECDAPVEEGLFDFGKKRREAEAKRQAEWEAEQKRREQEEKERRRKEAQREAELQREWERKEREEREMRRAYERRRYDSIQADTPSNTPYRGVNYSGGDYF